MKKLITVITLLTTMLTLVSCGPSAVKKTEPNKKNTETENVHITSSEEKNIDQTNAPLKEITNEPKMESSPVARITKMAKSWKVLYKKSFFPYFLYRSDVPYRVRADLEKSLKKVNLLLKKYKKAFILIKGFSTREGSFKKRKKISYKRAYETARYIKWKSGISLKKMKIYGKGLSRAKLKKLRRRVEILIILPK